MKDLDITLSHDDVSWNQTRWIEQSHEGSQAPRPPTDEVNTVGQLKILEAAAAAPSHSPADEVTANWTFGRSGDESADASSEAARHREQEHQCFEYEEKLQRLREVEHEIAILAAKFHDQIGGLEKEADELRTQVEHLKFRIQYNS